MSIDFDLIERIYEAAALPERWPDVLSTLGRMCGSAGGLFFTSSQSNFSWTAAPEVTWLIEDYIAEGWIVDNVRGAPMIAELHPGFRTDADFRSAEERAALPVYRDFLIPRGVDAAAGSVFQGVHDDAIVLTLEHFGSHEQAAAALPFLDRLRPALGRALSLTSSLSRGRAADAVSALNLAGVAAAVVSEDGRLRAANERFTTRMGDRIIDRTSGLRFADRFLQDRYAGALAAIGVGAVLRSVAVPATAEHAAVVFHLLPLKRGARDVFGWDGVLLLLAEGANASVPGADLLRMLFDLTPAEARLTRLLVEGRTAAEAAALIGVTEATARTHLRRVFTKTGVRRQTELVRLLLGLGVPD